MKITLLLILLSTSVVFAQEKNVSKLIKGYYENVHGADFYGASLDSNKTVNITIGCNLMWVATGIDRGFSTLDMLRSTCVEAIFKTARNIFKQIPESKIIKVYVVTFDDVRDEYGNISGKKKTIKVRLGLTREKANKLNWAHINDLAFASIIESNSKELIKYLDDFEVL